MWFWIIVGIILGLGVLVSLILAIPVDAVLDLDVHGKPVLTTRVRWLFGLVTFEPGKERPGEKQPKPEKPAKRERKPGRKPTPAEGSERFWGIMQLLRIPGLFDEVRKLLIRLIRAFDIRELDGVFHAGLPDPAYTGMLYGLYSAVTIPFGGFIFRNVRLYPAFDGFVFKGDLHAIVRVQPIFLVAPVVLFVFSLPVLRVIKTLIVTEWRVRKSRPSAVSPSAA